MQSHYRCGVTNVWTVFFLDELKKTRLDFGVAASALVQSGQIFKSLSSELGNFAIFGRSKVGLVHAVPPLLLIVDSYAVVGAQIRIGSAFRSLARDFF